MILTILQQCAALTAPHADWDAQHWPAGHLLITTVLLPNLLVLRVIPDADAIWSPHQTAFALTPSYPSPVLTGSWLPAAALWHTHAAPVSPWRPMWQPISLVDADAALRPHHAHGVVRSDSHGFSRPDARRPRRVS